MSDRLTGRGAAAGFTLLETLVALVVFTSVGLAMYSLINSHLDALARVRSATEETLAVRLLLEEVRSLNPGNREDQFQSSGTRRFGDLQASWRVVTIQEPVPVVAAQDRHGYHDIGLYEYVIDIRRDDRSLGQYRLRQLGHYQARFETY